MKLCFMNNYDSKDSYLNVVDVELVKFLPLVRVYR